MTFIREAGAQLLNWSNIFVQTMATKRAAKRFTSAIFGKSARLRHLHRVRRLIRRVRLAASSFAPKHRINQLGRKMLLLVRRYVARISTWLARIIGIVTLIILLTSIS
jgi:hypothetical protein